MKHSCLHLIIIVFLAQSVFAGPLPDIPHIVVRGEHELRVEPDILTLSLSISETGFEVAEARAGVELRSRSLLDSLGEMNIPREDISSARLQITPHYNWNNKAQIYTGTEVSRVVEVTLRDLKLYDDLIRAIIDAKVARIHSSRLSSSQEKHLREEAIRKAIDDGMEKARIMVAHLPQKVGAVYSISPQSSNTPFAQARYEAAGVSRQSAFEPGTIAFKESLQIVFYLVQE
jgi:uncharacterized protein YggE